VEGDDKVREVLLELLDRVEQRNVMLGRETDHLVISRESVRRRLECRDVHTADLTSFIEVAATRLAKRARVKRLSIVHFETESCQEMAKRLEGFCLNNNVISEAAPILPLSLRTPLSPEVKRLPRLESFWVRATRSLTLLATCS